MGKWKGVRTGINQNPDAPIQLFDLNQDVKEQNNVASEYPQIIEQMEKIMQNAHRDTEHFKAENFNL